MWLFLLIPVFIFGIAFILGQTVGKTPVTIGYNDDGKPIKIPFDEYRQKYICPVAYRYGARK